MRGRGYRRRGEEERMLVVGTRRSGQRRDVELTTALVLAVKVRYVLIELSVGGETMGDEVRTWRSPSREADVKRRAFKRS